MGTKVYRSFYCEKCVANIENCIAICEMRYVNSRLDVFKTEEGILHTDSDTFINHVCIC